MARHVAYVQRRWADLDAFGHVNNVAFLRYLQEARVDMLFVHAARQGADRLAAGVVVRRHEIDYRAPLAFGPQPLQVQMWTHDVRNATFAVGYEIRDVTGERLYAVASTVLVPYDLAAGRPRRLTPQERSVLFEYVDPQAPRPRIDDDGGASAGTARDVLARATKTHVYHAAVRFDDLDSFGHVNNVVFAEYMQEARIDFVTRHFVGVDTGRNGSVVAAQRLDYLLPVPSRTEPLAVEVWVTRLGRSSFDVGYLVRDADQIYVRAWTAIVAYDVPAARSRPLTITERDALTQFLEETA